MNAGRLVAGTIMMVVWLGILFVLTICVLPIVVILAFDVEGRLLNLGEEILDWMDKP